MASRRRRSLPTVTELFRIEAVLEGDPALRRQLGPKSCAARKRNGEFIYFAEATTRVAQELMARKLNPERAHVRTVLMVAADLLLRHRASVSDER